jgi:hypothetical protein
MPEMVSGVMRPRLRLDDAYGDGLVVLDAETPSLPTAGAAHAKGAVGIRTLSIVRRSENAETQCLPEQPAD